MKISIMRRRVGKISINKAKVITEDSNKLQETERNLLKTSEQVLCVFFWGGGNPLSYKIKINKAN